VNVAVFLVMKQIQFSSIEDNSVVIQLIFFPTMEVNETRNCLVTDILWNIRKSAEWIWKR